MSAKPQPGLLTMDRCGTAAIARQARKSARRDVCTSGKRFDAAGRAIAAALRVAPGGPPAASKALTVAQATLRGLLLVDREPPDAMTRLSMVRNPGLARPGREPEPGQPLPTHRSSTYFHRRVIHMIAFHGLRVGGVAPAMSGHRQAAPTPSGGREKRPFGRPCGPFGRRRADLVMDRHHGGPRS